MKLILLVFAFCLASITFLSAQTFLQLEKRGSFKYERYFVGEELTFQLEGDDTWYVEQLIEIYPKEGVVHLTNRIIDIKSISQIRDYEQNRFLRNLGTKMIIFGGSYAGISLLGTLIDWELGPDTWIISGSAIAVGTLLRIIFKHKTHKLGKRKMLRTMSLDFSMNLP